MSKVFAALAASVDGYITGPNPNPNRPLGVGGEQLFDWYRDGDTPSAHSPSFRLSATSAQIFDALVDRVGAVIAGRKTYDDSDGWDGDGPHPTAPLFVVSHRPAPPGSSRQTFVATGISDAIEAATQAAAGRDVGLMGSGVLTAALKAGLVDEVIIHQVPVLLGGGVSFFGDMTEKVQLDLLGVVTAPGVTHLSYSVVR
jgi:dihydrofolate reductase